MRKGWEYKKLGEVCAITMGQSPDGNSINEVNGIEFHQGKTCFGERFLGISPLYSNAPTKLAEAHSVLLCVRAPVGYPNITDRKICIGRGLCALYAKREIDNSFLYYSLLGKQSYFEKNATGSTFKAISSKIVSNTTLSIPPLSTQLAIVSELDKINELIRLKKEQLKDFDNLAQSLFFEMFGDPMENEKGWEVKKLGEIGEFKNGLNFSKDEKGHSIKFLGVSDFQNKKSIASDQLAYISLSERVQEDYLLKTGDLVFVRSNGKKELIGRSVKMYITEPTTYSGFCIRCRITDEKVDKDYIAILLKTPIIRQFMTNSGRGCNISNLNQKILNSIPTILPPLPLQRLFAQRIEQIEREKSEVQKSIQDLETLLASRMQYWFE